MLDELRIENFAIIDKLELSFARGFNVITGETGAGKSIIIDAVELLMGGKADSGMVRAGQEKALIEGVFALDEATRARLIPLLEEQDLLDDDGPQAEYITLLREVRSNGRTSARVNGVTVKAETLREIGECLVDIHGQSTHLSLFKPRSHLDLLDRFANLLEVRSALAKVVDTLNGIRAQIAQLQSDKDELQRRTDRLRYEVDEIRAANLKANEEADLLAERNRLSNSEQLATLTGEIREWLDGNDSRGHQGAVAQLQQVANALMRLTKIDPQLKADNDLAQDLSANVQDLALTMARYADSIEYNPRRLDELEERLELIKSLKRRYKTDSIAGILAHAEKAAHELETLENSEEALQALRKQEDKHLRHIGELAQRMSKTRQTAGQTLGQRIVRELKDLRMENTRFEVVTMQSEDPTGCYIGDKRYRFSATGIDELEFMMSANIGEPLRPLAKVASGGEAARIMLALKRVLAQADETPVLIFDEIDQGIGGRVGSVVGEKLWALSIGHQVMVVTHLAQLAGFGDTHYHVKKQTKGNRTATEITALNEDKQRIEELAAMLGAIGDSGKESAREILDAARVRKRELQAAP